MSDDELKERMDRDITAIIQAHPELAVIDAELNACRLLGKWEVNASGTVRHYKFDSAISAWTLQSGEEILEPPKGTVKVVNPRSRLTVLDHGTWEITHQLSFR